MTFLAQCSFPSWFWKKTEISQNFGHFWDSLYQRFSVPGTSKSERFLAFFSGTGILTIPGTRDFLIGNPNREFCLPSLLLLAARFSQNPYWEIPIGKFPIRTFQKIPYWESGSKSLRFRGSGYRDSESARRLSITRSRAQRSIGLLGHHDTTAATLFSENATM